MNSTIVEQATEFSFVCKWRFSGGVFERDFLFSPFFSIGEGLNGRLGINRTNSSGFFSLYFQLRKPEPEPEPTDFDQLVYFKFSLINQLDGLESIRKDFSHRFSKKEGVCSVSDFAITELLSNPHLGFLLENENCLTVEINLVKENSGYYYHKTRTRLSHARSNEDDGYDTVYLWEIQYFQSLREMAEKSEILYVQSRTFQTVQNDFHIVVYPRGKVNETHLGVFLKPEEPSCDQIHFSVVTLCIVNKNDLSMSVTQNYPNPIRKFGSNEFGSDEFISFKDLLDSSQGYVDNGSIKFVIKVLTLKETISKDQEELNNVYRLDLSGEFVIWRVDNFSAFIDFLGGGLNIESQPFEVHGCEHRMVISVNGSICASLKCEKDQKDFVYKVGVWNREEIVFAISTFYNPAICLKKLADVSSEDRSMTFILHIPDHSDPGIFEGICQLDPRSELWKPYATVCSDYPNILKELLDSAMHTENSDKAATHFSTLTSLVKETQDLVAPALDMMWKEILTGGHRIIDRDSRIQHIQTLLAETQSNAEVAKENFDEKLKSFASIIENLNGDRQSLAEEIRQFKREVLQLGKKAKKDERELEMSQKLLDESQIALAGKSSQLSETENKLKDLVDEVAKLERELEISRKLLDKSQIALAGNSSQLNEKENQLKVLVDEVAKLQRELEVSRKLLDESQMVLAETQRTAELAKIRFGEELTRYARGMENLNGDRQSLVEQIGQLKVEVWQLVGEKAEKDRRITHLEIENSTVKENLIFCQDKLMEERSIGARFRGFGLDLLSEVEIDKVLRFHAEKLEQTYEVIKQRRLGNQR